MIKSAVVPSTSLIIFWHILTVSSILTEHIRWSLRPQVLFAFVTVFSSFTLRKILMVRKTFYLTLKQPPYFRLDFPATSHTYDLLYQSEKCISSFRAMPKSHEARMSQITSITQHWMVSSCIKSRNPFFISRKSPH